MQVTGSADHKEYLLRDISVTDFTRQGVMIREKESGIFEVIIGDQQHELPISHCVRSFIVQEDPSSFVLTIAFDVRGEGRMNQAVSFVKTPKAPPSLSEVITQRLADWKALSPILILGGGSFLRWGQYRAIATKAFERIPVPLDWENEIVVFGTEGGSLFHIRRQAEKVEVYRTTFEQPAQEKLSSSVHATLKNEGEEATPHRWEFTIDSFQGWVEDGSKSSQFLKGVYGEERMAFIVPGGKNYWGKVEGSTDLHDIVMEWGREVLEAKMPEEETPGLT